DRQSKEKKKKHQNELTNFLEYPPEVYDCRALRTPKAKFIRGNRSPLIWSKAMTKAQKSPP
ncbi:MAG: hypothetical protein Q4A61_04110, partial [Porphyromonadaceae bacterium]|nr:hypothetical protein [Porphyromonadaceae bacterium]